MANPCTDKLTDIEYLEHMIPHHQVAIDMSELLIPYTTNPKILHLCRDIIRKQSYEIWEMEMMKNELSVSLFDENLKGKIDTYKTKLEKYNPKMSKSKDGACDPLFFKPDDHMKHMEHMEINDISYLKNYFGSAYIKKDLYKNRRLNKTEFLKILGYPLRMKILKDNEIKFVAKSINLFLK